MFENRRYVVMKGLTDFWNGQTWTLDRNQAAIYSLGRACIVATYIPSGRGHVVRTQLIPAVAA